MGGQLLGRGRQHPEIEPGTLQGTRRLHLAATTGFIAGGHQIESGLAPRHHQINVGQDLGIQQGAVQGAVGIVDAVTAAQGIQRVTLTGEQPPRHGQGIGDLAELPSLEPQPQLVKLVIHEAHVEGRIVDDELRAADKLDKLLGHGGEGRLIGQKIVRDAVHPDSLFIHQAIRLQVDVVVIAGQPAIDHLDTADFDDAVPQIMGAPRLVHPCGFGIQYYLAICLHWVPAPFMSNSRFTHFTTAKMLKQVALYTDGSCLGNPGPGGYAAVLVYQQHRKELSQGYALTTNNRMEMMAVIAGLKSLNARCHVTLTTDSQYVKQGVTQWMANWKRRGWLTANKEPVKNQDLWQALDEQVNRHQIDWHWVKGHSGHPENERCDELARQAAGGAERLPDSGYRP